ncbi:MAG: hypothetical protein EAZ89_15460 [Bacteroidetes bacterium]|nr:MAG: hypothetical protein EAZ89_15460 [Bacteroidota bacterium]
MKLIKSSILAIAALLATGTAFAQTTDSDDINISAAFSSSIDLNVTDGANISFVVASLDNYTNGLVDPTAYTSTFQVSSSVDFKVDLASTSFSDGNGNELSAGNFGYTVSDAGTYQVGTNHLLLGGSTSPAPLAVLGAPRTIVEATGSGNAGPFTANTFKIKFELGTAAARAVSGLPILLQQNIAPATYTSVVTLTASAMP